MAFGSPPAFMGYVGFVRFGPSDTDLVRATSADIRLSQEIIKPDLIDSRFDRTTYQLGPKIVEGSAEFPAIFDSGGTGSSNDVAEKLYRLACQRDASGKIGSTEIAVKYTSQSASFRFPGCIVNNWRFAVAQSDVINIGIDVIGIDRVSTDLTEPGDDEFKTTRIVTWNDAVFSIDEADGTTSVVSSEYIRNFDIEIANDAERFYTLNGKLSPQDIAPRKRDVTGSLTIMGRHPSLSSIAEDNENRCTEDRTMVFGYNISAPSCGTGFKVRLKDLVFEIEEMSLTNDLFETTVNYTSFPGGRLLLAEDPLISGVNSVGTPVGIIS